MNADFRDTDNERKINTVEKWARHKGKNDLIRHLKGERLTRDEAIVAKCYDCCNGYDAGTMSCGIHRCSLYPYMPFRDRAS